MDFFSVILISVVCGLIPSFMWLFFWLREDSSHPEPRVRIIEAFSGGILCTLLALPLERVFFIVFHSQVSLGLYFTWAAIEEILKFGACYFIALRSKDDDEPIDPVIYMIITALGFSALENTLFIHQSLSLTGSLNSGILTENLRFIGASLLHVLTSSIVGIFYAFSFYKDSIHQKTSWLIGLFFAIIIHTFFNFLIADQTTSGPIILTFSVVWWGIMALIIIIEKVKILRPKEEVLQ